MERALAGKGRREGNCGWTRVVKSTPESVVALIGEGIDVDEAISHIKQHLGRDQLVSHSTSIATPYRPWSARGDSGDRLLFLSFGF